MSASHPEPTQLSTERRYFSLEQVAQHLPQPELPISDDALEQYLSALYRLGRLRHTPNISPQNVVFLHELLRQHQPKRILELGCANGYSTLRMWQIARAWQAQIVTMDLSRPAFDEAQHHFATLGAPIEAWAKLGLSVYGGAVVGTWFRPGLVVALPRRDMDGNWNLLEVLRFFTGWSGALLAGLFVGYPHVSPYIDG